MNFLDDHNPEDLIEKKSIQTEMQWYENELEGINVSPEKLQSLYHPSLSKTPAIEDENNYSTYHLKIKGVTIQYKENFNNVTLTIKGKLPEKIIKEITQDLKSKLEDIENCKYKITKQ